jgi:two-component system chemotaxis response regulator CheY
MPVMDGIQVLEEIRRLDPKAKVVMVTANLKPSTLQRVTDLKVHSVLKKFPTRATLLAELQRLLGDAPTP